MNIITNGQNLAIAHTGSIGYVTAGFVGELVNKIKRGNVRSTESIRFPKGLNFLRNTNVSISLTMLILFMVIYFTC
jgi:PTS system ascorbate-specific IIC component